MRESPTCELTREKKVALARVVKDLSQYRECPKCGARIAVTWSTGGCSRVICRVCSQTFDLDTPPLLRMRPREEGRRYYHL